jgi:hypothetical protein
MLGVGIGKREDLGIVESKKELEEVMKKVLESWDNPEFLTEAGKKYIKESEEIAKKEFDSWQKSIYVWVR